MNTITLKEMQGHYSQRISGVIYSGINFLPALLLFSLKLESASLVNVSSAVMFAPMIATFTTLKGENVGLIFSRKFQNALIFFNIFCAIIISFYSIIMGSIVLLYSLNLLAFYRKDLEKCYSFASGLIMAIAGVTEIFVLSSLTITSLIFSIIVISNNSKTAQRINFSLVKELKHNFQYVIQVIILSTLSLVFLYLLKKTLIIASDLEGYVKSTRLVGVYMAIYGNVFVRSFFIEDEKTLTLKNALALSTGIVLFMFFSNTLFGLIPYNSVLFKQSALWWYVALDTSITVLKNVLVPESLKNGLYSSYIFILLFRIFLIYFLADMYIFYGLLVFEFLTLVILFIMNKKKSRIYIEK